MLADNAVVPCPAPASRSATILIVDDEDGVRRLMEHWVTSLGYNATVAGDADAAVDVLRSTPVDVAVCDLRMPGKDGLWLIEHIRREFPTTAVVIATGRPEMAPAVTLQSGVAGCLIKPFARRDLATLLHHALMPNSSWARKLERPATTIDEVPEV